MSEFKAESHGSSFVGPEAALEFPRRFQHAPDGSEITMRDCTTASGERLVACSVDGYTAALNVLEMRTLAQCVEDGMRKYGVDPKTEDGELGNLASLVQGLRLASDRLEELLDRPQQ